MRTYITLLLLLGIGPLEIHFLHNFSWAANDGVVAVAPVKTLLKENRLDEAFAICSQYEVLSTRDKDDEFACAWVYLRTDRVPKADKILDALKSNNHLPDFQLLRGYRLVAQKKYEEAKRVFDSVAADHRGTPMALTAQELTAEMYEIQDRLPAAAFIYNLVVREDPNRGRSNWGLGRFYLAQHDSNRAIKFLENTTRLWPRHMASRFQLAYVYLNQGEESLKEAFQWLRECYRLNKSDPEVLEQLGNYFEKKKKIPEAIKFWQRAVDGKKELVLANEKLNQYFGQVVQILLDQGKLIELLAKLETSKAISEQPKYVLIKGQVLRQLQKYEQASVELKTYLKTDPKNIVAIRELGICYLNMKVIDLALEMFVKTVLNEPTNGINHAWLGYAFEEKGDLRRAKESWKKAAELLLEPAEVEKANRKLATIEKRINKKNESEDDE